MCVQRGYQKTETALFCPHPLVAASSLDLLHDGQYQSPSGIACTGNAQP
jgi:hypothetical protein